MKKICCLLLCLILISTVLFACKEKGPEKVEEEVPDIKTVDKNITAEIRVGIRNDPLEERLIKDIISGFNEQYPNVKIEIVKISNYDTQIMGDFSVGEVYDVFWVADNTASMYVKENMLLNLEPYITQFGFDLTKYYKSMIDLGRENHSGPLYFLPRDFSNVVVYYNKDLFDLAGVKYPSNPDWNWEEFTNTCNNLRSGLDKAGKDSFYPLDANLEWTILFYSFLKSWGGPDAKIIDKDGFSAFDTPGARTTLTEMSQLVKNKIVSRPDLGQNGTLFQTGKAAMLLQSRPVMSSLITAKLNFDVMPFPDIGDHPSSAAGTTGYGIAKGSRNKDVAWALLTYMMNEDGQDCFSKSGSAVPAMISVAEDKSALWRQIQGEKADGSKFDINHDAFVHKPERAIVNDYYDSVPADTYLGYNGLFVQTVNAVLNQEASVSDALSQFATDVKTLCEQWKE